MAYEQYLRSQMRVIGGPKWDQLIRDIASDFAALKEAKSAQEILADSLLRRGLQVIEDLVSPVALLAGQRVDQIDALITEGTENVNAAVADAVAAASGIADMLAGLQAGGVDAELVIESADRVFLTPEQKTAFIGYAAAIALLAPLASPAFTGTPIGPTATTGDNSTKLATTAFVANAIDALKGAAPEALDTLYEIAAKLADDDTAISGILTALGNRLRVDTNAQGLNPTQQGNALTNLGATTLGKTLLAIADAAALRTAAGLGTAATLNVGAGNNNVVQLDASGHFAAALLADTTAAQAGTDANKLMTPARVAEAISALAKSGWEQIGTTQTLGANAAYVEQSWAAGAYREIMCIAFAKQSAGNATGPNADLRTSSASVVSKAGAAGLSPTIGFYCIRAYVMSGIGCGIENVGDGAASVNGVLSATTPDRLRLSPGTNMWGSGCVFAFFGMRG